MDQFVPRHASRFIAALLLAGLMTGLAHAQAPTTKPAGTPPATSKPELPSFQVPESPDAVVLKVSDQQFTKADIDFLFDNLNPQAQKTMATQGRKPLGDQFALVVMLSQQAKSHHLDQTPAFQHRLTVQKQQLEAQAAYDEIVQQAKVNPEDISQYYSAHAADYDQLMVRQFVVRTRAANAQTGPGLPVEEAKTRAEAIRKEVAAGTDIKKVIEDFKAPGDVIIEAEPRSVRKGNLRPELEKAAFALKDGEVSQVLDVTQAEAFFQVTAHSRAELKDVSAQIEETLRKGKIDAAVNDLKKKNTVWMDDQYFAAPEAPTLGPRLSEPAGKPPAKP